MRGNSKESFKNTTCPLLTLCKHIDMTKNEVPRTREAGQAQEVWFLMLLLTSAGAVPPGLCPLLCGQFYLSFRLHSRLKHQFRIFPPEKGMQGRGLVSGLGLNRRRHRDRRKPQASTGGAGKQRDPVLEKF